jgi:CubicO group peptidase (beta-lactamase class C family)
MVTSVVTQEKTGMPVPSLAPADPAQIGLSAAGLARVKQALQREIERGRIPGAVALIARRGRIGFFESLGVQNPKHIQPMSNDSIFRIYSMTKAIVSVATMMMVEEGHFVLTDPISRFLPAFAKPKVLVESEGAAEEVPAEREITIQDLLRHTSGLTYEFNGSGPVHHAYRDAKVARRDQTNADLVGALAQIPLLFQPGSRWEYSRSTDVLGRLLEVVDGIPLANLLAARVLEPLGMVDSGFHVPGEQQHRIAEPFEKDPESDAEITLLDVRQKLMFQSGGGGMVGTALDYARFLQMLLNRGQLDGVRLLSRKTVEHMTSDHLGPIPGTVHMTGPGYGFGLGFAVRRADGLSPMPGSAGQYYWGGAAGTAFWVDPREELIAILMTQAPNQREYNRALFRGLVYGAFAD